MSPIVITETDALNGLRTAVASRGASYIYQGPSNAPLRWCVYVWSYAPGDYVPMCIVGQALSALGVPLRLMYQLANNESVASLAEALGAHGYYLITPDAVSVLAAAQHVQDHATVNVAPQFTDADLNTALLIPGAALPSCTGCACHGMVSDASWGAALRAAVDQARANADARRHHAEVEADLAAREFVMQIEKLLLTGDAAPLALTAA